LASVAALDLALRLPERCAGALRATPSGVRRIPRSRDAERCAPHTASRDAEPHAAAMLRTDPFLCDRPAQTLPARG
jgi:hypothetical protein